MPPPAVWSPDHPALYDVDLILQDAAEREIDRVRTHVGLRKIEVRDHAYYLNGREFFLLSALDQGYNPEGLYTPPTADFQRRDVGWSSRNACLACCLLT